MPLSSISTKVCVEKNPSPQHYLIDKVVFNLKANLYKVEPNLDLTSLVVNFDLEKFGLISNNCSVAALSKPPQTFAVRLLGECQISWGFIVMEKKVYTTKNVHSF